MSNNSIGLALFALVVSLGTACDDDESKTPETAREYFDLHVASELVQRCGTTDCHGVAIDDYNAREPSWYSLALDADGSASSAEALQIAYDESIGNITLPVDPTKFGGVLTALDLAVMDRVDTHAEAIFSLLVRKPLPKALGGLPHKGGDNYVSVDHTGLKHLLAWIEMERDPEPLELTPLETRFGDEVVPVLRRKGCMVSGCHGSTVANPLKLDPGVGGVLSAEMTRRNHAMALHFVNHDSAVPDDSRLLAKALPAALGGIAHRGGNDFFTADDPDLAIVRGWIEAEGEAHAEGDPAVSALVYVARPPSPRPTFDVGAWTPGADLWRLRPVSAAGERTNLTATLHDDPVDIRTPAVSPDASQVLFAMRTSVEDCLNIYRLALDGGSDPVQLTRDTGCRAETFSLEHVNVANLSPTWSPDGRIYFISTRAGVLADKGRFPSTSVWSMAEDGSDVQQVTFSYGHEVDPVLNHEGQFIITSQRDIGLERHASLFTFPPNWFTNYHPHFGNQSRYPVFAQVAELPDFREILSLQADEGRFGAGALAVIDRNLGPDIEDPERVAEAGLPAFHHALTVLSDDRVALGTGAATLWRDPEGLPGRRFVAARSAAPADPTDPAAEVDFGLVLGALRTDDATMDPTLGEVEVLVDEPGVWEVQPSLVQHRGEPELRPTYLRPDDMPPGTGTALLFDAVTIESLLRDITPTSRVDKVRTDITGVRVVVGVPPNAEDMARPDAATVRNGDPESTRISNGIHGRRWTIGPAPAQADGSLYVRLPARAPVFLQAVNADSMAVGMNHDRWIFLNEGEPLGFGVATPTFDQFCGGCHGAYSGNPQDAIGEFDLLTSASVTLATHNEKEEKIDPIDATQPALFSYLSFDTDIQPLLDTKCATAACHDPASAAGGLDLSINGAGDYAGPWSNGYESLMALGTGSGSARSGAWQKAYVAEREARAIESYLVEKVMGRELQAPRALTGDDCTSAEVLGDDEKALLVRWIDLGATYLGTSAP